MPTRRCRDRFADSDSECARPHRLLCPGRANREYKNGVSNKAGGGGFSSPPFLNETHFSWWFQIQDNSKYKIIVGSGFPARRKRACSRFVHPNLSYDERTRTLPQSQASGCFCIALNLARDLLRWLGPGFFDGVVSAYKSSYVLCSWPAGHNSGEVGIVILEYASLPR